MQKKPSIFFIELWVGLVVMALLVLFLVPAHSVEGTKQFKFFDFGTYTVPEGLPDKFLDFQSQVLAREYIVNGKAELTMIKYEFSGSPNHLLIVGVVAYLIKDGSFILCLKTISTTNISDLKKWKVINYIDMSLYKTGKPLLVLVETVEPVDFQGFIDRMSIILGRQGV